MPWRHFLIITIIVATAADRQSYMSNDINCTITQCNEIGIKENDNILFQKSQSDGRLVERK